MHLNNSGATAPLVLQAGRCAAMSVTSEPAHDEAGHLYLRTIARALERHMHALPESSLHWVAAIGDATTFGRPTAVWSFDDCLLQVGLVQGNSEGMLLYVHAQPDRYEPATLTPLLRIKVLCGPDRAAQELQTIWKWLHSAEFRLLVEPREAPASRVASTASACSCSACPPDAIVCQPKAHC